MLSAGEYRYHSPAGYVRESDGRFVELKALSLTNDPATCGIAALG